MKIILLVFFISLPLFSQRADFYDTYDYSMKNYKGGDNVGEDSYKEYDIPPTFQKPPLVSPRGVQRPIDQSSLLQGQIGIRRSANPPKDPSAQLNKMPINPITGAVNLDAIAKQREAAKKDKEKKRQFLSREIEPYFETRERRMEIIFLTTFPFAAAFSMGLVFLAGGGTNSLIKTNPGFVFIMFSATGLSVANMISDINNYDTYMKNKKENNTELPHNDEQSQLYRNKNFNFSFVIGSKSF